MTIGQCFTQTTTISVNSTSITGAVALTGSSSPSLTLFFSPSVVQVTPNAVVNSTMAITVANDAAPGSYNVTVSGSNNGVSEHTQVFVTVTPSTTASDFYLSPRLSSLSILQGQAQSTTIAVFSCNGFSGAVNLNASAGVSLTASFNPTVVEMLPNGSSTSTMTIIVPTGTTPGNYPVMVSGTSGPLYRPTFITVRVVISNDEPPMASFTFTPPSPVAGYSVQFNANASKDPDGSVTTYSWAWGDGQSGSGAVASHSFDFPGRYTVGLTVTDSGGAAGGVTRDVLVAPAVLKVSITTTPSPPRGTAPLTVNFIAIGSGGTVAYSYSWDFGDGNQGSGQRASHTFVNQGDYNVTVTLTDSRASKTTSSALVVVSAPRIQPAAPTTDYTTVYVAGGVAALVMGSVVFLVLRRRHQAKTQRGFGKPKPRKV